MGTGWGAGNYGAGVHLIRFRVHMNVRGGKFPVGYSRIFRSILHPEGMKHTGNQKVVTAAKWLLLQFSGKYRPIRQNPFVKALSAPYRACTALPDKKPPTPLQSKIGAYGVSLFTDFKSGNYRRGLSSNFRVGANQIPLCSFQKRKAAYIPPENRGYVCPGSNLLQENSGYWPGSSVFW